MFALLDSVASTAVRTPDSSPKATGSVAMQGLATMDGEELSAVLTREGSEWQQVADGSPGLHHGHHGLGGSSLRDAGGHHYVSQAGDQLQLVLYQQRDLVLYDRRTNRAYARRLSEEQANALTQNRQSFCPLCRQHLDPSWAFVVEGYFDLLNAVAHPPAATSSPPSSTNGSGGFTSNEEAAAAAGLTNIPSGLLNCGYYSRFFIEEKKLGAGSFGAVYLCRHVMDEIELGVFAVKKLALGDDTKRLKQVVREVKALERLRHLNIIDYKHSWIEVSRHSQFCPWVPFLFILMEFCNAGSLEDLIWPSGFERGATNNREKATLLSEEMIWSIFLDVVRGLRHLHSRSILHRDLKPSNILLNVDEAPTSEASSTTTVPRALLSDFGTCEILGDRTMSGHVHGGYAIEFMAPERLRGEESDEPADMWSAGLVLYAMCYGDLPYHAEDPDTCREQVIGHTVLADLPHFREQALRGVIAALTAKSPVARPTAEEAENVSCQALSRHRAKQKSSNFKGPRSPQTMLPSLPAPPALELLDETTPTPMSSIRSQGSGGYNGGTNGKGGQLSGISSDSAGSLVSNLLRSASFGPHNSEPPSKMLRVMSVSSVNSERSGAGLGGDTDDGEGGQPMAD